MCEGCGESFRYFAVLNNVIVSTVKILDEAVKFEVPALKPEDQIVCRGAFSYSPESAHPKSNSVSVLGIPLSPLYRRGRGWGPEPRLCQPSEMIFESKDMSHEPEIFSGSNEGMEGEITAAQKM